MIKFIIIIIMSKEYSKLSYLLTKKINKIDKKNYGIYFTPPNTISKNIDYLHDFMSNIKDVLEPSCGSCEYIIELDNRYNNLLKIIGIELNTIIFDEIKSIENENIKLFNSNYLTHDFSNKKFDLIIGNPPYFVMKKKDVHKSYYNYFDGRPNIFILFIIKSLKELLNINGILSFILPKNFLNCLYYNKTRQFISTNYTILNIIDCNDNYIETQQETIIMIIQNKKPYDNNDNYCLNISIYTIFGLPDNIIKLKELYINSTSLFDLGFNVSVGNIVWNECKEELTNDKNKTLLIYSSDIKNNQLSIIDYSNKDKKSYINKKGFTDPLLVINRGYGVGNYTFNYCIINETDYIEYLIENHLICIKYSTIISKEDLILLYKKIINSFKNPKTIKFIEIYFGNNAINTTELSKILPIYDI
jgi:adenine-specific DNA-methyltransferase